ncbi:MAG: ATPase domain-containing protein [Candidatus ainarchaeum sp.]|nr:ATPase domain-containing protein [Candidatus ainarchaeum sp.]
MAGIVKTGIPGLDTVFDKKGFISNSSVLVSGEPGAGKTIFALEFIYYGAKDYKEPGIFISSEQSVEKIRELAFALNMPLEQYEKSGLISIRKVNISKGAEMIPDSIMNEIKSKKPKRVVLDSISPFELLASDTRDFRFKLLSMLEEINKQGTTLLATGEKRMTDFDRISFNPEDFLFDGLILMGRQRKTVNYQRVLSVIKMRGTKHSEELHPVEITENGLRVLTIK